ncbi:MAG: hypothetical protein IPH12_01775 [Saprospirales bacterium]|nr:hypothetical protein [Saprospirales bacterium]
MRFKNWLSLLFPVLVLASMYPACKKANLDDAAFAEHTAEYAFPLFNTTLSLKDLMFKVLNDSLSGDTIVVNADNTMTLYYSGDVAEKPASDIFAFFNFPPNAPPIPVPDSLYAYPLEVPDSVFVRRTDVLTGDMIVIIFNSLPEPVHGVFSIPQMSKNGVVFEYPFTVGANSNIFSPTFNLGGYTLLSDSNTLQFRYEAYLPGGERIVFPEPFPGFPGVGISLQNFTLSYVEGYWGFSEYPLTLDTIDIDINQTNLKGNVQVKDPKVTMTISNSWGFPTRGVVKYLSFIGKDGEEYKLESSVFNNDSIDFDYPSWVAGEIGQTKYTHVVLDGTNSNIATIFNAQPTQLIYEVAGISNAKRDPSIIGFLTNESTIALRMNVELVLEGSVQDFGAEQTLDLNFGSYGDIDTAHIESVEFKVVTENQTPIATALQLYFLDENAQAVDFPFCRRPAVYHGSRPGGRWRQCHRPKTHGNLCIHGYRALRPGAPDR